MSTVRRRLKSMSHIAVWLIALVDNTLQEVIGTKDEAKMLTIALLLILMASEY